MSTFLELSQRCKESHGPDEQLDCDIAIVTGWVYKHNIRLWGINAPHWWKDNKTVGELIGWYWPERDPYLPRFTALVEVAELILGPEENPFVWSLVNDFGGLHRARVSDGLDICIQADGHTKALALCAAGLFALHLQQVNQATAGK